MLYRKALPGGSVLGVPWEAWRYPWGRQTAPAARRASGPKLPFLTGSYFEKSLTPVKEGRLKKKQCSFGLLWNLTENAQWGELGGRILLKKKYIGEHSPLDLPSFSAVILILPSIRNQVTTSVSPNCPSRAGEFLHGHYFQPYCPLCPKFL